MKCPYCISEIDDASSACAKCGASLQVFGDLLKRMQALEVQVTQLKAQVGKAGATRAAVDAAARREAHTSGTDGGPPPGQGWASGADTGDPARHGVATPVAATPQDRRVMRLRRVAFWFTAVAMLAIVHALLVFVLNADLVWLRIASMIVPLPFGFLARANPWARPWALAWALGASVVCVMSMTGAVALVDGSPFVPATRADLRDSLVAGISIFCSFGCGMALQWLACSLAETGETPAELSTQLVVLVRYLNPERLEATAVKLQKAVASVTVATAAVTAAVSGLHGLIGS